MARMAPSSLASLLERASRPLVMGILNVTPDSFSDGGAAFRPDEALRRADQLIADGADLLDIGGESTRPGAAPVSVGEELRRVLPVLKRVGPCVRVPVSIDTYKAEVAEAAIACGAAIINDITALRFDARMAALAARTRATVILMHMRGEPRTMQRHPRYREVVSDVRNFLSEALRAAVASGIPRARIWIDPGLGFGKTVRHNLELMRRLPELRALGCPIVVGPSRKSFIGRVLDAGVSDRLAGTLACVAQAAEAGAQVVRVHDVKATVQFLSMRDAIRREHRSYRHRAASPVGIAAGSG